MSLPDERGGQDQAVSVPAAPPPTYSPAQVADAFEALSLGLAWRAMMGHSVPVNRRARFLGDIGATPIRRPLVLTPEQARLYPELLPRSAISRHVPSRITRA